MNEAEIIELVADLKETIKTLAAVVKENADIQRQNSARDTVLLTLLLHELKRTDPAAGTRMHGLLDQIASDADNETYRKGVDEAQALLGRVRL